MFDSVEFGPVVLGKSLSLSLSVEYVYVCFKSLRQATQ